MKVLSQCCNIYSFYIYYYFPFWFEYPGTIHHNSLYTIMYLADHSLFINCGGIGVRAEDQNVYDADNATSEFFISANKRWAYTCSGNFFVESENYTMGHSCGVSAPEGVLYEKARLCSQSLTYYGFCLHNGNYTVKLHFAEIVYSGNEDYHSLGKRVFDVYIQGNRVLKDFNIKEEAGASSKSIIRTLNATVHDNLLTINFFWNGKGSLRITNFLNGPIIAAISVTADFKAGERLSAGVIAIIVVAAVFALFLCLAFVWRMGWLGDRESRMTYVDLRGKPYTLKQVKDATHSFSPRNEIGKGHFGTVYKAELPDMIVAVKKLAPHSKHVIDELRTELYAMKSLKHDNVVELLDGCSKNDLHLLIYEYMEKGSLQRALFDPNSKVQLDWQTRVCICLGIARGLKYLHEDNLSHKIVHRNIKSSNILLDRNLNAKVSDLGLAKFYEEENPYEFIQRKGTVVYMAPEYATRQAITDKADVYSYGIVVLEIVSGKNNATYNASQETVFLLDTACFLHSKGRLLDLVDKRLCGDYDKQQALKIIDLAMKCVNQSPTLRPSMTEVVSVLEPISEVATPSDSLE